MAWLMEAAKTLLAPRPKEPAIAQSRMQFEFHNGLFLMRWSSMKPATPEAFSKQCEAFTTAVPNDLMPPLRLL
ncbi:MAG: hypothetical protein MK101_05135 [Phycisphaerales bacterium]|nr:hypothetical protein [Phycisphaerales bacterium]